MVYRIDVCLSRCPRRTVHFSKVRPQYRVKRIRTNLYSFWKFFVVETNRRCWYRIIRKFDIRPFVRADSQLVTPIMRHNNKIIFRAINRKNVRIGNVKNVCTMWHLEVGYWDICSFGFLELFDGENLNEEYTRQFNDHRDR